MQLAREFTDDQDLSDRLQKLYKVDAGPITQMQTPAGQQKFTQSEGWSSGAYAFASTASLMLLLSAWLCAPIFSLPTL